MSLKGSCKIYEIAEQIVHLGYEQQRAQFIYTTNECLYFSGNKNLVLHFEAVLVLLYPH